MGTEEKNKLHNLVQILFSPSCSLIMEKNSRVFHFVGKWGPCFQTSQLAPK